MTATDVPGAVGAAPGTTARLLLERALAEASLPVDPDDATVAAIQHASLPVVTGLPDVDAAAAYRPSGRSRLVGGDWYDAFALDDHRVVLGVGDACGHGIAAAGLMAQARNGLRALSFHGVPPGEALTTVGQMLSRTEPYDFATAILAVLDVRTRRLAWARAGHPPVLWQHGGGARFLHDPGGPPLGAFPGTRYASAEIELAPGDALVLYTDGLVEHPPAGIGKGLADLLRTVAHGSGWPAGALIQLVQHELVGPVPRDDVCILTVRLP